jgi:cytoskeletal protein CcmA (bactofilin family)
LIFGEVKGNLKIGERVEIGPTGNLSGNLKTPSFVVCEGAIFDGDCRMSGDIAKKENPEEEI